MRIQPKWTAFQATGGLAILALGTAGLTVVPSVLNPLAFLTMAGFMVVLGLVALTTYYNGQSPDSVGQLLHHTENARPGIERR